MIFKCGYIKSGKALSPPACEDLKTYPVKNTRDINKSNMVYNDLCPKVEVDPETYEVRANGEILTCEPASELPMAQRYFLY